MTSVDQPADPWDLAEELVDRIVQGNPLPDERGNPAVWHFGSSNALATSDLALPAESLLGRWRAQVFSGQEQSLLAEQVATLLTTADVEHVSAADHQIRQWAMDWRGPLGWLAIALAQADHGIDATTRSPTTTEPHGAMAHGIDPAAFGRAPHGQSVAAADLALTAPQSLQFSAPIELARGAELVATARLHPAAGGQCSVQVRAAAEPLQPRKLSWDVPLLVQPDGPAWQRWQTACREFAELFPPALCYARIVPVDEVVTLTLFYREDELLQRLMLDEAEIAELERLWDELFFVSHEPLQSVVALEQLIQFATQDRQDLVGPFQALQQPVQQRAEDFQRRLLAAEPRQVEAVIALAGQFWRRATPRRRPNS